MPSWSADVQATPFWRRMPQFFRFPAYRGPLVRNVVLSLAFAGALALPSRAAAALVAAFASVYLAQYGFVVIERVAQGYLDPGRFPPSSAASWRPLKLAAIMLAALATIALVRQMTGDGVLTLVADAAVALLFPASVMTLAVTNRLRQAIDPRRVFALARRIGWPYLVLFLFLLLLVGGSQQAFELVAPVLGRSTWLLALASSFVGNYFFFIICALMGYVLYQYSAVLGLPVLGPGDTDAADAAAAGTSTRELALGRCLVAGDVRGAIALLDAAIADDPGNLSLHERRLRLLLIVGDTARALACLERYLELLVAEEPARALRVAREALQRDATWRPESAALVVGLAQVALAAGQSELALELMRDFEARHAGDASTPVIASLRARASASAAADEEKSPVSG